MTRQPRGPQPAGTYHLMARGVAGTAIFRSDDDWLALLLRLGEIAKKLDWAVLIYSLLGTHYHVLVDAPADTVARGMQLLNGWYAQRFNRIYGRRGPLFESRYKHVLVVRQAHLLWLIRYIGANAREAGLCEQPEDWPRTNYGRLVSRPGDELTVGERRVRALFGHDDDVAVARLRAFVDPPAVRPALKPAPADVALV